MRKILTSLVLGCLVTAGSVAAKDIFYSPLTGQANGHAGPGTKQFSVEPHFSPSTALVAIPDAPFGDGAFQWVNFPLTVPKEGDGNIVMAQICYDVDAVKPGSTYISQTRFTRMGTPNVAKVKFDDPTDRGSTTPTCYKVQPFVRVNGTITLALKVVFGSREDRIKFGMIKLRVK